MTTDLRLDYLARNRDTVVTSFRLDEALQLTVPVAMRTEHYFASAGLVRGTATYGRFRRFGVRTEERIGVPSTGPGSGSDTERKMRTSPPDHR